MTELSNGTAHEQGRTTGSDQVPSEPAQPFRWSRIWTTLGPLLRHRRGAILALSLSSLLCGFAESGILAAIAQVAAALVNGETGTHLNLGPIHVFASIDGLLGVALALALVRLALQAQISYLPARIAADLQAWLRTELFSSFSGASWAVQSRDREGQLQEIATNQVGEAIGGIQQSANLLTAVLSFLVLIASALVLNVVAALVVVVTAAGLFALLRPLSALGSKRTVALSRAYIDYANGISEASRLAEEAHVFGVAAAERQRLDRLNRTSRDLFFRTQILARLVPGLYQSLIYLFVVAGLAVLYASGTGHAASLGAVVLLLVRAGTYGQAAQAAYHYVRQCLPYLEQVVSAQQRYLASAEPAGHVALAKVATLTFENVEYAYETGRPVLCDFSFQVEQGEAIGVVGPSGAGKSTLIQILLGLRRPDRGRYLVNGVPAERIRREDWRTHVAYVPQDPRLLHASVADNIRFFRAIDDASVEHAARLAGIHDDVMAWSDGYDTIVGPRADAVSGGQQQRICLARALAGSPEVLVLDEPTSALDPRSEALIQQSLAALRHELTLFVVAHRMSTLTICERVMVVVDGRLEAFDPVEELLGKSSYYRSATALAVGTPWSTSTPPN